MRYLLILALLASGCNTKSYEERCREEARGYYQKLTEQIIEADKNNRPFEILEIYKYKYYLADFVKKIAIPDGWEPVGGMTSESVGESNLHHVYMQTIRKVDKTKILVRQEDGTLAISRTAEVK